MRTQTTTRTFLMATLAAASLGLTACNGGAGDDDEFAIEPEDLDPTAGEDGKFEAWNSANNPAFVDGTFLLYAHQLPLTGQTERAPIVGDYWATSRDNLNHKWDGPNSQSPAEKWGKAFGIADMPKKISEASGVLSADWRKACTTDSECTAEMDGSICAKPKTGRDSDATGGRCIPTWWGICHGWAPYALMEPTPVRPVTRQAADGTQVTFYPGDITGLMSLIYGADLPTKFISQRCNKDMPPTDSNGRLILGDCRDMNPGSWHVLVTNMLGLRKQGFVLDQTYDDEVWNQPAWKYDVKNGVDSKLKEITKDEAAVLLGANLTQTALLPATVLAAAATKSGTHTATVAGKLVLKLAGTGDVDLYVKVGSAPTESAYDCRPYASTSDEECEVTVTTGAVVHWMVKGYGETANVTLNAGAASSSATYSYNSAAKKFFHVKMDFTFIVEGDPSRDATENVSPYATKKTYEYVLEADEFNKIIGGEWLGASRLEHPDFAWWATGTPTGTAAGMTYAQVKAISDEAAAMTTTPDEVKLFDALGFTNGQSKYAAVVVAAGVKKLQVSMTGTGDADLYVRKGQNPTLTTFNCRGKTAGTATESCTVNVAVSGGTYYVRVKPVSVGGTYPTVTVTALKVR